MATSNLEYEVTDAQIHAGVEYQRVGADDFEQYLVWSINYAINDEFLLQYDPEEGYDIPASTTAAWNGYDKQDAAYYDLIPGQIAKNLNLPTLLKEINNQFGLDFYGDTEAKALFDKLTSI